MTAATATVRAARPGRPARPRRLRADLLLWTLSILILMAIWRLQNVITILAVVQLPSLAALGSYLLFLLNRGARRRLTVVRVPVILFATAMFVFVALSIPGAIYPGAAFSFLRVDFIKNYVLMILVAASIRAVVDVEHFAAVHVFGAIIYSTLTLSRFTVDQSGRLGNLGYYDANDFAFVLVLTVPFVVYFLRSGVRATHRLAAAVAMAIIVVAMVRTGSRGGLLGLIAVLAFILLRFSALPARTRWLSVAALSLGLVIFGSESYWQMMRSMLNPSSDYNFAGQSEGGRMEVWKRGLGYMLQHPFLGVGAMNFPIAEGRSQRALEREQRGLGTKWTAPHNSFVMVGAELGLPALLTFIAMLVTVLVTLSRIAQRWRPTRGARAPPALALTQALQASMIGYLVAGFFLSQAYSAYLYVLLGMVAGLAKVAPSGPNVPQARSVRPRP